jgi:hypothetical protein
MDPNTNVTNHIQYNEQYLSVLRAHFTSLKFSEFVANRSTNERDINDFNTVLNYSPAAAHPIHNYAAPFVRAMYNDAPTQLASIMSNPSSTLACLSLLSGDGELVSHVLGIADFATIKMDNGVVSVSIKPKNNNSATTTYTHAQSSQDMRYGSAGRNKNQNRPQKKSTNVDNRSNASTYPNSRSNTLPSDKRTNPEGTQSGKKFNVYSSSMPDDTIQALTKKAVGRSRKKAAANTVVAVPDEVSTTASVAEPTTVEKDTEPTRSKRWVDMV